MAQVAVKKKKKSWYHIVPPKNFENFAIPETPASEPNLLVGRVLKMSLSDLTGDPKKQNIQVTLKIVSVNEKSALTEFIRYEVVPSYVKRMMRKERDKVDDSFVVHTKDNVKLRVKPLVISKAKTKKSVLTLIRSNTREMISEVLKNQTFSEFISDVISTKFHKAFKEQLKKVYPVATFEFRVVEKV